jgi:hypothetical protein
MRKSLDSCIAGLTFAAITETFHLLPLYGNGRWYPSWPNCGGQHVPFLLAYWPITTLTSVVENGATLTVGTDFDVNSQAARCIGLAARAVGDSGRHRSS